MSRDPLDRYYTDDRLAARCIEWLLERYPEPSVVLEPCSGGGAFGRAAAQAMYQPMYQPIVLGCDIDPDADPGYRCDRVAAADWRPDLGGSRFVWIVTNPHYQGVYATIADMRALQAHAGASVLALLLRATVIEQVMNSDDTPHALAVSSQRPRWGGPGGASLASGDTCGSVLCVWQRHRGGPTTIHGLGDWRPRGKG
jgi:hypothetical protein